MTSQRTIRLVYFAWVRERIGLGEEERNLPDHVITIHDLLSWLPTLGDEYAGAMEHAHALRVAIDQEIVEPDAVIGTAREIAIFPPMTGG